MGAPAGAAPSTASTRTDQTPRTPCMRSSDAGVGRGHCQREELECISSLFALPLAGAAAGRRAAQPHHKRKKNLRFLFCSPKLPVQEQSNKRYDRSKIKIKYSVPIGNSVRLPNKNKGFCTRQVCTRALDDSEALRFLLDLPPTASCLFRPQKGKFYKDKIFSPLRLSKTSLGSRIHKAKGASSRRFSAAQGCVEACSVGAASGAATTRRRAAFVAGSPGPPARSHAFRVSLRESTPAVHPPRRLAP